MNFSLEDKGGRISVHDSSEPGSNSLTKPQTMEGAFGSDHRVPVTDDREAMQTIDRFAMRNSGPLSGGFDDLRSPDRPQSINGGRRAR